MPRGDYEKRRRQVLREFTAGQKEYFAGQHKRRLEEIREAGVVEKDIRTALARIAEEGAMSRLLKQQEFDFPERQGRLSAQRADLAQRLQDLRVGREYVEGAQEVTAAPGRPAERVGGVTIPGRATELTMTQRPGLLTHALTQKALETDILRSHVEGRGMPAEAGYTVTPAKPGSAVGLGEEVATPLSRRRRGLLRGYTDAYMRYSATPLGYAMGLQGINRLMQGYFRHVGEPFERRVYRPTVRGLRWLVTPTQVRKRAERRGLR